ncbi:hypothetical protein SAMN05216551_101199 [Chitinasiproducens palmae]|uniref:Uncharacterized protein n=1 Tax=Chitinasiproducens palmae TaxID=1770053 RepID=A0A1H2PIZ7_9BURK|nr:hypothetical protein SAMN05216551_101199 [Chitinasiproducens palmae]
MNLLMANAMNRHRGAAALRAGHEMMLVDGRIGGKWPTAQTAARGLGCGGRRRVELAKAAFDYHDPVYY